MLNTKICYLYRDASNYKMYNEAVLNGKMNDTQKQFVLSALHEGEYFIPSAVGLDEERFEEITVDDHVWFELSEYSFEETAARPTTTLTPSALVNNFRKFRNREAMWLVEAALAEARLLAM